MALLTKIKAVPDAASPDSLNSSGVAWAMASTFPRNSQYRPNKLHF
jgi:hypothetical protein